MSDTIGTVMMVAIVILLAVSVGGFILGQYDEADADVYATVEFEGNADDSVDVVWTKRGTAEEIVVSNGTTTETITSLGESQTMWFGADGEDINVIAKAGDSRTVLTKYEPPDFESTVYAESSTCDSAGTCQSRLVYNGTEIDSKQGVTILAFDSQGVFHSYAWYDTNTGDGYSPPTTTLNADGTPAIRPQQSCSDCAERRAFNHITQTIPAGHYIVVVGGGQPGDVTEVVHPDGHTLEDAYKWMGAEFSNDDTLEYNDSWILATQKTGGAMSQEYEVIFEKHAPRGDQTGVSSVSGYFYAPHDN